MSSHSDQKTVIDGSALTADPFHLERGIGNRAEEVRIQDPTPADALKTVFGLGPQELATLDTLASEPGSTTKHLADELDRDQSNVNRSLRLLMDAGLAIRRRRILESGGFFYEYFAAPEEICEQVARRALERWTGTALEALETCSWSDISRSVG